MSSAQPGSGKAASASSPSASRSGRPLRAAAEPAAVSSGCTHGSVPFCTVLPGFLSRSWLIARYQQGSGTDLPSIGYYVAFAHWRAPAFRPAY